MHERSKTKQKSRNKLCTVPPAPKDILCLDGNDSSCIQSSDLEKLSCKIKPNCCFRVQLILCIWYFFDQTLALLLWPSATSSRTAMRLNRTNVFVLLSLDCHMHLLLSYMWAEGWIIHNNIISWLCWITSLWLLVWAVQTTWHSFPFSVPVLFFGTRPDQTQQRVSEYKANSFLKPLVNTGYESIVTKKFFLKTWLLAGVAF